MVDPDDPRLQHPRRGCILLGIPPVAVVLTLLAYAFLFYTGLGGRPADGEVVTLSLVACPEAQPFLEERVARMGLTDAVFAAAEGGLQITARMPADADAAAAIPRTLEVPGRLEIRAPDTGEVLFDNAAVADASVRMDLLMRPSTLIALESEAVEALAERFRSDPEGRVELWMDGESIGTWHHSKGIDGTLHVDPSAENDKARMFLAARRAMALASGPLPCEVAVRGVRSVP